MKEREEKEKRKKMSEKKKVPPTKRILKTEINQNLQNLLNIQSLTKPSEFY
jgi:hypothetical protein